VRGRLGEPDIAWNHGLEDLPAEMLPKALGDLFRQFGPGVIHREQDAEDIEGGIEAAANQRQGLYQLGQAGQGVIFALNGNYDALRRGQGIYRQQAQGGRTVDKNEAKVFLFGLEGFLQAALPGKNRDQLYLGAGQIYRRWHHREAVDLGFDHRRRYRGFVADTVIDGGGAVAVVDADAHSGISLGVEVYQQDLLARGGETGRQVDGGCRLPYPTLLVDYRNCFAH